MRLLVSNDDGIDSPGLLALARTLSADHDVTVVAPRHEQSAKSHSLSMHDPLRIDEVGPQRFAVNGTPADCVYIAIHDLMVEAPPEMVISGINRGANLGSDVHYSGTVAAAREGALQNLPAIAISLVLGSTGSDPHWDTACAVVLRAMDAVRNRPLPMRTVLNLNVPPVPLGQLRGIRACRLGHRVYAPQVDRRVDPRGRHYVWIGGPHLRFEGGDHVDGAAIDEGWATATPLTCDITDPHELERLRAWTDD